jgi:hypothetical protein
MHCNINDKIKPEAIPFHFIVLPLMLILLSLVDAYFTVICIQRGGQELNPFMRMALHNGTGTFFSVKMLLTVIPAIVLAALRHRRIASYGLYVVNLLYLGIVYFHLIHIF